MTTVFMRQRVISQLRSYPSGQDRTAAEIATGMDGKLTARDVEPTLRLLRADPLLGVVCTPGKPDRWRLA